MCFDITWHFINIYFSVSDPITWSLALNYSTVFKINHVPVLSSSNYSFFVRMRGWCRRQLPACLPERTEELAGLCCSPSLEWECTDCVRQLPAPQGMENYCWGGSWLGKIILEAQGSSEHSKPFLLCLHSHCFLSPLENVTQPVSLQVLLDPNKQLSQLGMFMTHIPWASC